MEAKKFFIVGAPRAGTTWLYSCLAAHPDVHVSPIKEPNYFSSQASKDNDIVVRRYGILEDESAIKIVEEKGVLHFAWIKNPEIYRNLLKPPNAEKLTGEASVGYLHDKDAAINLHSEFPDSKIIIMLRDPVGRAVSHARMDLGAGLDDIRSVEDVLHWELHVGQYSDPELLRYLKYSLYFDACKRYIDLFGMRALLFVSYKDVKNNPRDVLRRACRFFDITELNEVVERIDAVNESKMLRSARLSALVRKLKGDYRLKKYVPSLVYSLIQKVLYKGNYSASLDGDLEDELRRYFKEDKEKTENYLGLEL